MFVDNCVCQIFRLEFDCRGCRVADVSYQDLYKVFFASCSTVVRHDSIEIVLLPVVTKTFLCVASAKT